MKIETEIVTKVVPINCMDGYPVKKTIIQKIISTFLPSSKGTKFDKYC